VVVEWVVAQHHTANDGSRNLQTQQQQQQQHADHLPAAAGSNLSIQWHRIILFKDKDHILRDQLLPCRKNWCTGMALGAGHIACQQGRHNDTYGAPLLWQPLTVNTPGWRCHLPQRS
jgi:hypothetical protein